MPQLTRQEKIAAAVSAAILIAGGIYWIVQIAGVIQTLKLAYG